MKYRIVGGFSFYERAEIKDMISYLTVALNPDDSVNLMRIINVPVRGIGKTTTDALADLAVERETSIWGAIEIAVQEQRLPGRTLRGLEAFHKLMADFVERGAGTFHRGVARADRQFLKVRGDASGRGNRRIRKPHRKHSGTADGRGGERRTRRVAAGLPGSCRAGVRSGRL